MSSYPEPTAPSDRAVEAANSRALSALSALVVRLGEGMHTLNLVAKRKDGPLVSGRSDLSVGFEPTRLAVLDEDEFCSLRALLLVALEGSAVEYAVLVATTSAEPRARACGWVVRDGWVYPMDAPALQAAVSPPPDTPGIDREVYAAPALPAPGAEDHMPDAAE
ncbi:hypothetical protein [Streptomyces formicae]